MGGNHYYCAYCDRSFKDVQSTRQKHLISVSHIKNREEYYNNFKEPEKIVEDELRKKPCIRFMNNEECPFGTVCRYSHYTPQSIEQLKQIAAYRQQAKHKVYNPDPEQIVKEFFDDTVDPDDLNNMDSELWPRSQELKNEPNLPPSLQPMTYRTFKEPIEYSEWGWK